MKVRSKLDTLVETLCICWTAIWVVPRAVLDVMVKRIVLVPKFVIKFHFIYPFAVAGNEGSAA
jgi:hypothetical protein